MASYTNSLSGLQIELLCLLRPDGNLYALRTTKSGEEPSVTHAHTTLRRAQDGYARTLDLDIHTLRLAQVLATA